MSEIIAAHFDGQVIVPDEPVHLPVGLPLRVRVEIAVAPAKTPADATSDMPPIAPPQSSKFADFSKFAADLPDAPADLGAQHDHYLYGSPKR